MIDTEGVSHSRTLVLKVDKRNGDTRISHLMEDRIPSVRYVKNYLTHLVTCYIV